MAPHQNVHSFKWLLFNLLSIEFKVYQRLHIIIMIMIMIMIIIIMVIIIIIIIIIIIVR